MAAHPFILTLIAVCGVVAQPSKPHRVVIELNVPGRIAFKTVLANAENLKKAFAPEPVEIEIVCEGPGLDLLVAGHNPLAGVVTRDHGLGVEFAACGNTVSARRLKPGSLFPFVRVVKAGVAEVVRKQEDGWSYLKGAG